jgi:S-layer protein (TIGR01567 family)
MDYVRVMGVCLLLIIVAATLPMGGFSENPNATAGSAHTPGAQRPGGGAVPIVIVDENFLKRGEGAPKIGLGEVKGSDKLVRPYAGPITVPERENPVSSGGSAVAKSTEPTSTKPAGNPEDLKGAKEAVGAESTTPKKATLSIASANDTLPVTATISGNATAQGAAKVPEKADNVTTKTKITGNETTEKAALSPAAGNVTTPKDLTQNVTPQNLTAGQKAPVIQNVTPSKEAEAAQKEAEAPIDRIWREGVSTTDYTWTPLSYSGFFYDMDEMVGTEELTVRLNKDGSKHSRSVDAHYLKYSSKVQPIEYKFVEWGKYQVLGFMAEKYFAGYKGTKVVSKEVSLINEGQLRKVLLDDDQERTITSGSVLPLEEGYELRIKQVDINGNKVYLALARGGKEIDSKVIVPSDVKSATYQYKVKVAGDDTPIIMAHVSNVFASAESNLVTVSGLFQISDAYKSVEDGDKYEKMKVTSVSDSGISMENEDSFTLRRGTVVRIFGEVGFQIADADDLRFAPIVERTGPFEIRGTVVNPAKTKDFTWTPYNFEGFYYDIDEDIGSESLVAKFTDSRIDDKDLRYEAKPKSVKFKFEDWGRYAVIGFMADKYFAGYNNQTKYTDEFSAINEGELRKVLMDSDDDLTIPSGSVLALQEGYELRIKQVDLNGNKVYLALAKDGKEVDSKVVVPTTEPKSSNYLYKVKIGSTKDVPLTAAHVQSVFKGVEADLATIDGLFQVSSIPENVEEGEKHGKMKVDALSDNGITMRNDGSISLGRGKTVEVMGNLKFKVADNAERSFAPIAERVGGAKAMALNVSEAVVNRSVKITVKSGAEAVSEARVMVNGELIGSTDADGSIGYTPKKPGTFEVIARKVGYNDAKGSMVVASYPAAVVNLTNKLSINVPGEVLKGESFIITVISSLNQTPVAGANISFDNSSIGITGAQGTIQYSSNATGWHTVKAESSGFEASTRKVLVLSPIRVDEVDLPKTGSAGQEIKVKANVRNAGTVSDKRTVELKANGKTVDSKEIALGPGENATVTLSYKPKDPGVYRLGVEGREETVTVEKPQANVGLLIGIVLVLLIAIGAGAYLYKTGELEKLRKRLQGR